MPAPRRDGHLQKDLTAPRGAIPQAPCRHAGQSHAVPHGAGAPVMPSSSRCHISADPSSRQAAKLFDPDRSSEDRSTRSPQGATPSKDWWSQTGSNRRPHACKARALPTELWPRLDPTAGETGTTPTDRKVRKADRPPALTRREARGDARRRRRLRPPIVVGLGRLERPTSPLSGVRSNHLSYRPGQTRPGATRQPIRRYPEVRKRNEGGRAPPMGPMTRPRIF